MVGLSDVFPNKTVGADTPSGWNGCANPDQERRESERRSYE